MHSDSRTNWYRQRQQQERDELARLESDYQQRVRDLEEMEDNRKSRVAEKVKQQQSQSNVSPARLRGATIASTSNTGTTWSSVVKGTSAIASTSSTDLAPAKPARSDNTLSPQRATRADRKSSPHKRQGSGNSSGGHSRGASPSRSSIQAGTVRKMHAAYSPKSTTSTTSVKSTSDNRVRLNTRSITTAPTKSSSKPTTSVSSLSLKSAAPSPRTGSRLARSPSISPTISAIASNFAGAFSPPTSPTSPHSARSSSSTPRISSTHTAASATSGYKGHTSTTGPFTRSTTPTRTSAKPSAQPSVATNSSSNPSRTSSYASSVSAKTSTRVTASVSSSSTSVANRARTSPSFSHNTLPAKSSSLSKATGRITAAVIQQPSSVGTPAPSFKRSSIPSPTPRVRSPTAGLGTTAGANSTANASGATLSPKSAGATTVAASPPSPSSSPQPRLPISARAALEATVLRGTKLEMRGSTLVHSHGEQALVWDISKQECVQQFSGHTAPVHSVALRSARSVVSASKEEILLWDTTCSKVIQSTQGCTVMAAHPTLEQIAIYRPDTANPGQILLLHLPTLSQIGSFETGVKNTNINAIAWASDTHLLFSSDSKVRLMDTEKSKIERTFDSHSGTVLHIESFSAASFTSAAFSSSPLASPPSSSSQQATHCFTFCDKQEVICWQIATGKAVSRTMARGSTSTLFVLDDRNSKSFSQQLLPILVDPEGITVIASRDDNIKMEAADSGISIAVIAASTPVLLI